MRKIFDIKHGVLTLMIFFIASTLSLKAQAPVSPLFEEGNLDLSRLSFQSGLGCL